MKKYIFFAMLAVISFNLYAQTELKTPQASQSASVMQKIGLTEITINYHSPLTKDRKIWGDLVPYNEVWRAGANENTTITFSTDVKVEGKNLVAGTYGLHMIPTAKDWTIIFSKDAVAWGSFFYNEKNDALRVTVTPTVADMQEWLSYTFLNPQDNAVTFDLHWEKLMVPVKITVDVPETVFQNMKNELTNVNGFFWQGYNQAASYCVRNKVHLDEASTWIDKSIGIQKTFANLNTKSALLEVQGKHSESETMKHDALAFANEEQLNAYAYQLLGDHKNADAVAVFRDNVKRYPASWNVYDSLGEALEKTGDKKGAIANYKLALANKAPADQAKRISSTIKKLEVN